MKFRLFYTVLALAGFGIVHVAMAAPVCDAFSDTAENLPLEFLDRADPIAARVTVPLEDALLTAQIALREAEPLHKHYCQVGMFAMVVRFVQPVLDDSIAAIVTEATYEWDAAQDPAGWVLSTMQRHHMCARGPAAFAPLCK